MSHLNCLCTMPEITDEAVIEALFAQRPYEEKVLNSAYLEIPAEYQRELSIPNIERMSAEFTEWIANPPKVSYRDGHYYVFDGQHTLMTRKSMNGGADLPIICKVYYGLTQEEEAILFSRQTGVSAPLTAGAKLRAALFGKDAEAIAFLNATESTGLQLGLDSTASPLDATGNTVYFQHFEKTPEPRAEELLAAIQETGLARRVRLLFSCTMQDDEPVPDLMRKFSTQLGCQRLYLPTLRSRADEIPSLASLYLNSLNIELGKQISGFEPRAIELLRQYDWPNNYTQFKNVLQTLAALTNAAYIRGSIVLELLSKERSVRRTAAPAASGSLDANRTLEEIIRDAVRQAVDANGGNRAAAARQLGIGRTTLWRYLGRAEDRAT